MTRLHALCRARCVYDLLQFIAIQNSEREREKYEGQRKLFQNLYIIHVSLTIQPERNAII